MARGDHLQPVEAEIRAFLRDVVQTAIHLVAITPDGPTEGYWFGDDVEAAVAWAVKQNMRRRGVYWTPNEVRAGVHKKAAKTDIVAVRFIYGDVDTYKAADSAQAGREVLEELDQLSAPPTIVIDSGNGLQPLWRLTASVDRDTAEAIGRQVKAAFRSTDSVQNIDRVVRLPATVNWPNRKKQEKHGLVPVMASVIVPDIGLVYTAEEIAAAFPAVAEDRGAERAELHLGDVDLITADDLGLDTFDPLRSVIEHPAGLDRSGDALRCAGDMHRAGYSKEHVLGVLMNPANAVHAHIGEQADQRRAALRIIGKVYPAGDRPRIVVRAGELHKLATEAEAALIKSKAPLYVRGGSIVRPVVDDMQAAKGRRTKVARLVEVSADMMLDHLSRSADWERFNERKKANVPSDPPRSVATTILARDGDWKLPHLAGVITTPTLRPDGTILSEAGFDPETRLLLRDPPALPPIAERPSQSDAANALEHLERLLDGFPFIDAPSKSVALSMLITPIVRGAMPVAPIHVAAAPVAGSGKSYLVDLASAILTGERAPVVAAGRSEEETEKRLGGALMSGQSLVSIDNVNGELGGDMLCQLIERPLISIRPLGLSKLVKIESRTTIFATGNNIMLVEDMTRRAVLCSLDPNEERPELRQFSSKPFDAILADRGSYVAAALTIARAYIVAGCPGELPPLASFEDWSRIVRSALVWLGRADPIETMERVRANDPSRAALETLFQAWHQVLGAKGVLAGELKTKAEEEAIGFVDGDLYRALSDLTQARGGFDSKQLGKVLRKHQGRIAGGLKLVSEYDKHAKQQRWRVVRVSAGMFPGPYCDLA